MQKLRIGFAGLGGIATRMHIPALSVIPGVVIQAGAEINKQQAERTQQRFGIPRVYDSYERMLADEDLDAVYVCLPNSLHIEATRRALAQGLHVFCEKPMGLSATQAADVARMAAERQCTLMPGYTMRYVPNYVRARDLVQGKRIGKVLQIQAIMAKPGPYTGWDPKSDWYYDRDNIGVLYDQGSHAFDLIRYVCGVEIAEVQAVAAITLPGLTVPDSIVAAFQTAGGAVGSVNLMWGACANLDMLAVHGTAGSILASWNYFEHLKPIGGGIAKMATLLENASVIVRRVSRSLVRLPATADPYLLISQDFVNSLRDGSSPQVTAWDGVRTLEVLEMMAGSLTGQEIGSR
jgi:predicted dehydrogenase